MNYIGMIDDVHRDQRRISLFQSHNFACVCPACDLPEEQLQVQDRLSDEFERLLKMKKEIIESRLKRKVRTESEA